MGVPKEFPMAAGMNRRTFLAGSAAAFLASHIVAANEEVPSMLDHILLGSNDLDAGIAFVEQRTGIRAAVGGVHPGRGTRNALLSLGERRYLEIIAPDPQQSGAPDILGLHQLRQPRLVGWAAHPTSIEALAQRLREAGIVFDGPRPGSRNRPDGGTLKWTTLTLKDNHEGLLPFFIEWSADSLHPSADAPKGCRLVRFEAVAPDTGPIANTAAILGLDLLITKADAPQLRAKISSPRGELLLTS
jgi:hypothetical protein